MQAILITAYKDPEMLYRLCGKFDRDKFRLFIHIDKRYAEDFDVKRLKAFGNVEVYSKYAVTWGSIKHLYTILALLKRALKYDDVKYVHIISGQDYPVTDLSEAEGDEHIYLSIAAVPEERYRQYNICCGLDQRKRQVEYLYRGSVRLQKLVGINRGKLGSYEDIYKGNIWSSMPAEAARYALETALDDSSFLRDLKTCYIPEEFFFQTIFLNSPEWKDKVVRFNRRYNDWNPRDGIDSVPAVLDERDMDAIRNSDAWFARKTDSVVSSGLLDQLDGKQLKKRNDLVSIVITTCNREMDILERALKSAVEQTYENKEIIVVNDYPPYKEKIEELLKSYPDVIFISNEEQSGACVARNKGIEAAKGEYVSPLDDDDEWLPEKLEKQMAKVDDETVMVYCINDIVLDGVKLKPDPKRVYPEGDVVKDLLAANFVSGGPLLKRSMTLECGGYDPLFKSCQDLDLWIRVALKGKVRAVREPVAIAYMGHSSITTGGFERRLQGWENILEKHEALYKKYPGSRRSFCKTIVREAAKKAPIAYSLKILLKYGNVMEYMKGMIMRILDIY